MGLITSSSIRDEAGKKPYHYWQNVSVGSTGSFTNVLLTPDPDVTYEITHASFILHSGATTSNLQLEAFDGTNHDIMIYVWATAVNYFWPMYGTMPVELPFYIQLAGTISTAPASIYTSFGGWMYKRGEGVLD